MNQFPEIDPILKGQCVKIYQETNDMSSAYEHFCSHVKTPQTFTSFKTSVKRWQVKMATDAPILDNASLGYKLKMHNATVHVGKDGEFIQAWVKQHTEDEQSKFDQVIEAIKDTYVFAEPVVKIENNKQMMNMYLPDQHFGHAKLEDYLPTQKRIFEALTVHKPEEVVIPLGSDLFHYDNFNGTTSNGTSLGGFFEPQHWRDAMAFWCPIIELALKTAKVTIIYVKGNHDESMSWGFVQVLAQRYGDKVIVDDSIEEFKYFKYKNIFLGFTHGDKSKRKHYDRLFSKYFRPFMADCYVIEVHIGHLHEEVVSSPVGGIQIIMHGTGAPDDSYTVDNGFGKSYKTFMLYLYEGDRKKDIIYV